jgi:hypothetical protein
MLQKISKDPLVVTNVRRSIRLEGKTKGLSVMQVTQKETASAVQLNNQTYQARQLEVWGRISAKSQQLR